MPDILIPHLLSSSSLQFQMWTIFAHSTLLAGSQYVYCQSNDVMDVTGIVLVNLQVIMVALHATPDWSRAILPSCNLSWCPKPAISLQRLLPCCVSLCSPTLLLLQGLLLIVLGANPPDTP